MNGQLAINKKSGFHEYQPHDKFCEYQKTNRYLRAISKGKPYVSPEKKQRKTRILIFEGDESECQTAGEVNAAPNGGDNKANDNQVENQMDDKQANETKQEESGFEKNANKLGSALWREQSQ